MSADECGNGELDGNESCDDGGQVSGDGCDEQCNEESGWTCSREPSACVPAGSCTAMTGTECQQEDCCLSLPVAGGTFGQGEPDSFLSTVTSFGLDKYEVTVARFRRFVAAYDAWPDGGNPAPDAGAHSEIPGSGWSAAWDVHMPASSAALAAELECDARYQTWIPGSGNERLPITCVSWYVSFAFCAWDGGRLPTEAEWEYAAAAGSNDRRFPWGDTPVPNNVDASFASYYCLSDGSTACALTDILDVGSKPLGQGYYGQMDLGGSMWEWTLDWEAAYPSGPQSDYAKLDAGVERITRGSDWGGEATNLAAAFRYSMDPTTVQPYFGVRCARSE